MADLTPVTADDARRAIDTFGGIAGDPFSSAEVKDETARRHPISVDLRGVADVAISFMEQSVGSDELPRDVSMYMLGFMHGVVALRIANGEVE